MTPMYLINANVSMQIMSSRMILKRISYNRYKLVNSLIKNMTTIPLLSLGGRRCPRSISIEGSQHKGTLTHGYYSPISIQLPISVKSKGRYLSLFSFAVMSRSLFHNDVSCFDSPPPSLPSSLPLPHTVGTSH